MGNIPKIIHYCWFGGKEKPNHIKQYIDGWKRLGGYEIIEWNESNFDINECDFIKNAYRSKKWAFVSDYARLSVLKKFGGIYLDTDVEVKKDFKPLLNSKMFLGYIYNCSIGTAVIGAEKDNIIISELLELYKNAKFIMKNDKISLEFEGYENYQINNNNDLFTVYFINNVNGFLLSNKKQVLENVTVYPKEYFERKTFNSKKDFSIHHCYGSWYKNNPNRRSKIAKIINLFIGDILYDKLRANMKLKKLPYYEQYKKDKRKE
ncbi:glycosyltransferase family 32 protein [Clostridium perfringens]|uniref:glycosyltransferase family 32 protein n=2 Tax=Clostridium perfringens TaxID=1502 RepID=UPI0018E4D11C|nr:glycosyltransferase [Clostridium perfringens]MDM0797998.1 glycosyltransferase [Clostridium perfringens]MDM0861794.1 glycosyltransferase [Clostridium perfringens]MDM0980428.1 glycosyltransferase [Clostridium perfringens]